MPRLIAPRTVLPLVGGVGLVAILVGYADLGQVSRAAHRFQLSYLPLLLLLTIGYQGLRATQWWLLLRQDGRGVSWRVAVMSYMGGELSKALPGGQYVQTYILRRAQGTPIAVSAAATTVILWLEVVVCLAVVALLGVGPWSWIRPLAIALLGAITLVAVLLKRRSADVERRETATASANAPLSIHGARHWLDRFADTAAGLLRPQPLGAAAALSTGYIALAAAALWTIAGALGVGRVGVEQALVVYAFALAANLLIVIPIDLGLTELGGLAALMLFGVPRADAVAILLLQRALSAVLTGAVALAVLALLREQVIAALRGGERRERPGRRPQRLPTRVPCPPACERNLVA